MPSQVKTLLVIVLLVAGVACGYALGVYAFASVQNDTAALFCPTVMAEIIQSAKGNVYEVDPDYVEPESYYLVTYSVNGNEITNPVFDTSIPNDLKDEQRDNASQNEAWRIFTTLIPPKDRRMVAQYIIFTDGSDNTLAAVDQTPENLTHWIVEVDIADLENKDALLFTLIHEYAHLLTLNDSQVSVDEEIFNDPYNVSLLKSKAEACPNYFEGGGCSHPDSYMNAFYNRFWVDINTEWEEIDALQYEEDLNPYYQGLFDFYMAHQDQFVDDYATTHPAEDIAESFAYFVFSPKPDGTSIRDQKVSFFYEYPELIELRQSILKGTCSTVH